MNKTKTRKASRSTSSRSRSKNIAFGKKKDRHFERIAENCPKCGTAMVIQVTCPKCHYSPETAYASLKEAKEFTHAG